jgi:hypothetical protein
MYNFISQFYRLDTTLDYCTMHVIYDMQINVVTCIHTHKGAILYKGKLSPFLLFTLNECSSFYHKDVIFTKK